MAPDNSLPDPAAEPALEPAPARRPHRRKANAGLGEAIGSTIVGFDYQVFRATKPPAILVESAKPVRGLSGEGGATQSIGFPNDELRQPAARAADREPDPTTDH